MNSKALISAALAFTMGMVLFVVVVVIPATEEQQSTCGSGIAGQGVAGPTGVTLAGLNESQLQLARNMVAIGKQRNMSESVIVADLMAGATESTFRNLANTNVPESLTFPNDGTGSDGDSVGPHQLRASVWGKVGMAKLMDPVYQINWFYDQASTHPGFATMDSAALAQAVEVSAPNAYAGQADLARQVYTAFAGVAPGAVSTSTDSGACTTGPGPQGPGVVPGGPFGTNVVAAARRWLGTTYAWGGGNADGPSQGIHDGGVADTFGDYNKTGFDCSGLTLYSVAQASGKRITLPHNDQAQMSDERGQAITNAADLAPGDIIVPHAGHVFIWLGNNQVIEAPESGDVVKISPYTPTGGWQARRFG